MLGAVHESWVQRRDGVVEAAAEAVRRLSEANRPEAGEAPPNEDDLARAIGALSTQFDEQHPADSVRRPSSRRR